MTNQPVRAGATWLALREPADAAARSGELAGMVRESIAGADAPRIHDLGSGTGSTLRWLAPLLPGTQQWLLYDRDADLLARTATTPVPAARDGAGVSVQTRECDITRLPTHVLAGADLITASALLDMLTAGELDRLIDSCTGIACPVLVTLSVVGRVQLTPPDPLDGALMEAFNAHQRRTTEAGSLLGPDAAAAAVAAFAGRGRKVVVRPSPWRLGPDQAALATAWLTGWVRAACEQRPELAEPARVYLRKRHAQAAAGALRITLHHQDLFVPR